MSQESLAELLRYAAALFSQADGAPVEHATRRGWLDSEGRITEAGKEAARALADQEGTRSAFRIG